MNKSVVAFVLAGAALGANAATVGWTFKGTTYDSDDRLVPFWAYIEVDTGTLNNGPYFEGPGTGIGKTGAEWWVDGKYGCYGGGEYGYSRYSTSSAGFAISSLDAGNDCGVVAWVTGSGTSRFEVAGDQLTQWFDLSGLGTDFQIYMSSSARAFQAVTVDFTYQMIPEPSPVALIGAGLAGLIWVRRRKDAREQA
ncbi:PEP-CTERM sorting domain-containing protein [Pseudorhodoferax soli]|uniref:Putative secreted protein with PEP-CTERM sorting signal n=1 Tax=Pseudorhodoferax soli TaxID=545864 RepID=A0A368XB34_9BURK|nr:PEP-CTERM sorting domain-containing protein [Pseudorhodoferax soli]RCW65183.1 putative secreted protein with PEP-CTERM sorting signal [Pseudorhodoferax soli]